MDLVLKDSGQIAKRFGHPGSPPGRNFLGGRADTPPGLPEPPSEFSQGPQGVSQGPRTSAGLLQGLPRVSPGPHGIKGAPECV